MPLKLTLNRGEKVVINGCLIAADANKIKLSIESPADIIRESEIISEADVDTPIKQLAANIQKLLVFPDYRPTMIPVLQTRIAGMMKTGSTKECEALSQSMVHLKDQDFYKAFTAIRAVF